MGSCCEFRERYGYDSYLCPPGPSELFYPLIAYKEIKPRVLDSLPYLHYLPNFSQDFFVHNFSNKSTIKFNLEGSLNSINYAVIQHTEKLYIGGGCSIKAFKNDFIAINLSMAACVEPKEHMLYKKCNHKYIATEEEKERRIFSIGGMDDKSCLRAVERYDIGKDVWEEAPMLTEEKHLVGACCFRDRYIFVFGGYNNMLGGVLKTIEYIDLNLYQRWRKVFLTPDSSKIWSPRLNSAAIQVSAEYILIFGGFDGSDAISQTLMFNVTARELHKSRNMEVPGVFPVNLSAPIYYEKNIYAFCIKPARVLHCYDIGESTWEAVPARKWLDTSATAQ